MSSFANQVALITGAASGLGLALMKRFLDAGARCVGVDVSAQRIEALKAHFDPERVEFVVGSVADYAVNESAVEAACSRFGGLDVFIGNAGIWDFGISLMDLPEDKIDAAFDEVFSVNVKGYLLGAKASAKALRKSKGSIVFTLSNAALYSGGGGPLYVASKHAGVPAGKCSDPASDARGRSP